MTDEKGVIQFECRWIRAGPPSRGAVGQLNYWRGKLHDLGLVGVTDDCIGYGNMSVREVGSESFVITGTQTGNVRATGAAHYTRVVDFCLTRNRLTCVGPVEASSEAMTHGIVYRCRSTAHAVVHIHSPELWQALKGVAPTTDERVEAGTPGMAREVERVLAVPGAAARRLIVMGGHRDGLLAFGVSLEDAAGAVINAVAAAGFEPPGPKYLATCQPRTN